MTDLQGSPLQGLTEELHGNEVTATNILIILGRMVTRPPEAHANTIDRAPEALMEVEVGRSHLDDPLVAIRIARRLQDVPTSWNIRATHILTHPIR